MKNIEELNKMDISELAMFCLMNNVSVVVNDGQIVGVASNEP